MAEVKKAQPDRYFGLEHGRYRLLVCKIQRWIMTTLSGLAEMLPCSKIFIKEN